MTWNLTLFRWRMRALLPITLVSALLSGLVVLLRPGILQWWFDFWSMWLVFVQGLALAARIERRRSPSELFLHSHGFSRDTLWRHSFLAGATSVALAWLPVALLIWSPLRAMYQDQVVGSEWFPFGAAFEWDYPIHWLVHGWLWLALAQTSIAPSTASEIFARSGHVGILLFVMMPLMFGRDDYLGEPGQREQICWTAAVGACTLLISVSNRRRYQDIEVAT